MSTLEGQATPTALTEGGRKAQRNNLLHRTHVTYSEIVRIAQDLTARRSTMNDLEDAIGAYRDAVAEYSILRIAADLVENAPKEERA